MCQKWVTAFSPDSLYPDISSGNWVSIGDWTRERLSRQWLQLSLNLDIFVHVNFFYAWCQEVSWIIMPLVDETRQCSDLGMVHHGKKMFLHQSLLIISFLNILTKHFEVYLTPEKWCGRHWSESWLKICDKAKSLWCEFQNFLEANFGGRKPMFPELREEGGDHSLELIQKIHKLL